LKVTSNSILFYSILFILMEKEITKYVSLYFVLLYLSCDTYHCIVIIVRNKNIFSLSKD